VWIAESDDYADPRLLERLVGRLDENAACGLAYCQSFEVDSQGSILRSMKEHTDGLDPDLWARDFTMSGREACARFLAICNIIPNASAVLLRRAVLDRIGPADETLRVCGDWKFWTDALMNSDLAFVAEPLNYFRVAGNARAHRGGPG
jgi:hypothetical protein